MTNIEIAIGFVVSVALIIWGAGLKKGLIQIAFIAVMLILYGLTQFMWPENGKNIFLGVLIVMVIVGFIFKEKFAMMMNGSKKKDSG